MFNKVEEKKSPVLELGSFIHTAVLEPMKLENKYFSDKQILEEAEGSRSRKVYKEYKQSLEDQGKVLFKSQDFDMCSEMVMSAYSHPKLKNILPLN